MPEPKKKLEKNEITLFFPSGDGVKENSHTATYKSVKAFREMGEGRITFKTVNHGTITWRGPYRLKEVTPGDAAKL